MRADWKQPPVDTIFAALERLKLCHWCHFADFEVFDIESNFLASVLCSSIPCFSEDLKRPNFLTFEITEDVFPTKRLQPIEEW